MFRPTTFSPTFHGCDAAHNLACKTLPGIDHLAAPSVKGYLNIVKHAIMSLHSGENFSLKTVTNLARFSHGVNEPLVVVLAFSGVYSMAEIAQSLGLF